MEAFKIFIKKEVLINQTTGLACKEWKATHHRLGKDMGGKSCSSRVSPKWPSSSVVEMPEPMLPWKIHHVILFASAVQWKEDGREHLKVLLHICWDGHSKCKVLLTGFLYQYTHCLKQSFTFIQHINVCYSDLTFNRTLHLNCHSWCSMLQSPPSILSLSSIKFYWFQLYIYVFIE